MLETVLGDTLVHDGSGTTPFYTPPFQRGGEAAVFTVEVTHLQGSPSLTVTLQHKNVEDSSWSAVGAFSAITTVGVATKELSGLKEELRFAFTLTATVAGDWLHVLIPAPMWLPY